jgi:hypothetical protein
MYEVHCTKNTPKTQPFQESEPMNEATALQGTQVHMIFMGSWEFGKCMTVSKKRQDYGGRHGLLFQKQDSFLLYSV